MELFYPPGSRRVEALWPRKIQLHTARFGSRRPGTVLMKTVMFPGVQETG